MMKHLLWPLTFLVFPFLCCSKTVILKINTSDESGGRKCLRTNFDTAGEKLNETCIFPFIMKGVEYSSCTFHHDGHHKYWCSTKVDRDGNHEIGNWGYCDSDCVQADVSALPLPNGHESCGKIKNAAIHTVTPLIVNGLIADEGSYPFIAALGLQTRDGLKWACGGSLINRRYVLTAAHCHTNDAPIVAVVLGLQNFNNLDRDLKSGTIQRLAIPKDAVTVHERFDFDDYVKGFDIALVRLPSLAKTDSDQLNISPICLNFQNETIQTENLWVAGWGQTSSNILNVGNTSTTRARTDELNHLQVPLVDINSCKMKFDGLHINAENHICAGGEKGKDSCSGDSGGPLVAVNGNPRAEGALFLYGIVSFGGTACNGDVPGVYTNVEKFIPWIKQNLKP